MIDERSEELAALHALDLLEPGERAKFVAAVAADPELAALVRSLSDSSAALAHLAPAAEPPAALRARVLASAGPSRIEDKKSKIIPFPALMPWLAAASFALIAGWIGLRYIAISSENSLLRDFKTIAEVKERNTRADKEAEHLLAARQTEYFNKQLAASAEQLAEARQRATGAESRLAETALQLASAEKKFSEATQQLAQLSARLDSTNRLAADARAHADELGAVLASSQTQIAALTSRLKTESDLANFKITTLASLLKNSPAATAVAVWNPATHEGVLRVAKLPALAADKDYQLWVVDPHYPNPVDGGVFSVDPQSGEARVKFAGKQPIDKIDAFAVTLERKGGVPKAEGPFVLLGK